MPAPQRRATLAGLCAIALWSSLALLTTLTGDMPPFQVLATCFGIAAVTGLAWLATARGGLAAAFGAPRGALALSVAGLFGYHALYFVALRHAPVIEANLLNYLWPLLIVLFAALLPGGKLRAAQVAGALLGLAAAVLLVTRGQAVTPDPAHAGGYLAALGAAVVWAGYSVLNRCNARVPTAAIVPACAVVALLGAAAHFTFEDTVPPDATQWLVLLAMGIGPTGLAFQLWDHGTKRGDLALLGNLSYLAPLLSTLLLVASGRAQPHPVQAAAVVLLLAGAWLGMRPAARH